MLGSKLVAGVLSKRESAHEQTEHEVEHGHEGDGVVSHEGLGQDQAHLAHVLDQFGVLASFVSSLGEVNVSFAVFLLFAPKMSRRSTCKQFHFFDNFRLIINLS